MVALKLPEREFKGLLNFVPELRYIKDWVIYKVRKKTWKNEGGGWSISVNMQPQWVKYCFSLRENKNSYVLATVSFSSYYTEKKAGM